MAEDVWAVGIVPPILLVAQGEMSVLESHSEERRTGEAPALGIRECLELLDVPLKLLDNTSSPFQSDGERFRRYTVPDEFGDQLNRRSGLVVVLNDRGDGYSGMLPNVSDSSSLVADGYARLVGKDMRGLPLRQGDALLDDLPSLAAGTPAFVDPCITGEVVERR
jgi:hypothetical protein